MNSPTLLWAVRALWLTLPFTLLVELSAATSESRGSMQLAVVALFWLTWAAAMGALLIPLPSTLTLVRVILPIAPIASIAATVTEEPSAAGWIGIAAGALAAVLVMSATVGDWFVDGASWGDERRMALRPPAALLLGPVPLAWMLTVVPITGGVLLAADARPWIGGSLALLGVVTAWLGFVALWRLARRWAVFVPAGLTLVDDMALAEPIFLARRSLRLSPARADTDALDLTVAAPGLVLQVDLGSPIELVRTPARGSIAEITTASSLLIVPSRPAALLEHAESRGITVSR